MKELIKQYNEMKEELKKKSSKEFHKLFVKLFEKHPILNSISFKAYANFFADGDPTPFYIRTYNYEGELIDGTTYRITDYEMDDNDQLSKEVQESIYNDMSAILDEIPNDLVQDVYGDDVEITIYRDGTVTSCYYGEHD